MTKTFCDKCMKEIADVDIDRTGKPFQIGKRKYQLCSSCEHLTQEFLAKRGE
jgi:hypothetical protein